MQKLLLAGGEAAGGGKSKAGGQPGGAAPPAGPEEAGWNLPAQGTSPPQQPWFRSEVVGTCFIFLATSTTGLAHNLHFPSNPTP